MDVTKSRNISHSLTRLQIFFLAAEFFGLTSNKLYKIVGNTGADYFARHSLQLTPVKSITVASLPLIKSQPDCNELLGIECTQPCRFGACYIHCHSYLLKYDRNGNE